MLIDLLRFGVRVSASLIFGSAAVLAQAPMVDITPAPGTIAITGGKLLTITHGVIENGVVLIEGGKISAVGTAASVKVPKGATIVDAKGMTVYPGLIDSETRLGLSEIALGPDDERYGRAERRDLSADACL